MELESADLDVVCVGMVTPAEVYVVDKIPKWNTGSKWNSRADFVSDDAAIVAMNLATWGLKAGLICNKFGEDVTGRNLQTELEDAGLVGEFLLDKSLRTPYEIVISDSSGGRTYIWDRRDDVLRTLFEASTKIITRTNHCYFDWYDLPYILPAIKDARSNGVSVFFNIEDRFGDSEILSVASEYATCVQANSSELDGMSSMQSISELLISKGVSVAVVTGAANGCSVSDGVDSFIVKPPSVRVVDANGAGAVLSAGMMYGLSQGWDLKNTCKFAVAAASKKCELVGPVFTKFDEALSLANRLGLQSI